MCHDPCAVMHTLIARVLRATTRLETGLCWGRLLSNIPLLLARHGCEIHADCRIPCFLGSRHPLCRALFVSCDVFRSLSLSACINGIVLAQHALCAHMLCYPGRLPCRPAQCDDSHGTRAPFQWQTAPEAKPVAAVRWPDTYRLMI
jgi:hypothetical protein